MTEISWPNPTKEDFELARKYGYTPQLIARFRTILGHELKDFLKSLEKYNRKFIRVNTLKIAPRDLIRKLEKQGFELGETFLDYAFEVLYEPYSISSSKEYLLGYFYIQDISSMIPPLLLDPKPGELILDLAAAPGGKTTHIAQITNEKAKIVAVDISRERMRAMRSNINRLGIKSVLLIRSDGRKIVNYNVKFDKILLDAPCTGEGVIPRDPQRKRIKLQEYKSRVHLQRELLRTAWQVLKPGGLLVYSTCTYAPEENEHNVSFAVKELGMDLIKEWPIKTFKPSEGHGLKGVWRVYTHRHKTLGAFYAILRKKGD
ncbi:MAG TPA: RsmB/NOP family class I SAM-dependent RNA methyltransferase [Euryarchaeota archaeon]|nr:RsmB/NOP family class I SAM-dependent RNA methyltransferase [Euryarchaeota archaeon]